MGLFFVVGDYWSKSVDLEGKFSGDRWAQLLPEMWHPAIQTKVHPFNPYSFVDPNMH